jgi:hypothetical protein
MSSEQLADSVGESSSHEVRFGDNGKSVVQAITDAIMDVEHCEITDLPPLYESVDSEALTQLMTHHEGRSRPPVSVSFAYAGWTVSVRDDGTVTVEDLDETTLGS